MFKFIRRYRTTIISAGLLIIAIGSAIYFFTPAKDIINNEYNSLFVTGWKATSTLQQPFVTDESPGTGPGNNPIAVQDHNHFTFAVLGDTQDFELSNSAGGFKKAVGQLEKFKPNLVMTVGDLIQACDNATDCSYYKEWKNIAKPILPITYEVVGNHDRIMGNLSGVEKQSADQQWSNYFNLPTNGPSGYAEMTYSFNVGNSHFVVLDSEKPDEHEIGQDQRDWLEKDLAANQKSHVFVFFHEPAFPMSYKIGQSLDFDKKERDPLWTILDKYNVTAVFNGHEHIFSMQTIEADDFPQAKNVVDQFIIGNTDADEKQDVNVGSNVDYYHKGHDFCLVEVNGNDVTVKLYSVDGDLIKSFDINNK